MQNGIFVTGTDTNVGKTWVGQQLIKVLIAEGVDVIPRKPIESAWPDDIQSSDAWRLATAANKTTLLDQVCPYRFKQPVSPVRAARLEDQSITLGNLKHACQTQITNNQFLHVEGAGGFYSPIAENALNADLAQALGLPILLVAEDKLGCINQILLSLEAIQNRQLETVAIFLNTIKNNGLEKMNNQEDLAEYTNIPITRNISKLASIVNQSDNKINL